MPRIVGRYADGALVVAVGGACVVVGPDLVDDAGHCVTAPEELRVTLVGAVTADPGFAPADEPMPDGLLSADQIAAMLDWEVGYVDGVPGDADRPGLSSAEVDLYLRYRHDTGDAYPDSAALAVVDRPFSLDGFAVTETDSATIAFAPELEEPHLVVQLCASMAQVQDLSGAEIIADAATDLIDRISYLAKVEEFYPALAQVVTAGAVPELAVELAGGFTEDQILDFVQRLVAELDRRRPWPKPALVSVDPETWPSMGASVPIGWVDLAISDLEWAVKAPFADVPDGENPLLVLRIRGGQLVALVGDAEPNPTRFLVLLPDAAEQQDPAEVTAYLERYAGLRVESEGLVDVMAEAMQA
ncbi:hypothetical protein [Nocardia suismassiliense]|uniref:hypothetical protein n=1 Tax=Nocardia suismassiliense TaxID=2077092 RepID=UPI00131F26B5|nr:hypothetical protein [Nocardia suismassiliense]